MMQKRNIFHLLLAAALLTGCSAELEQGPTVGGIPIDLGYSVVTATAETRAGTNLNNDALTSGSVAVSVKKHTDGTYTTTYNYTAAAGGALSPATASNQFYYETDGSSSDIIAYYPATASTTFSVETDQIENGDYQSSDLMWAQVTDQLPTNSTVNLQFSHKMSKIIVNATAGTGITSITSVTLNSVKPKVTFTPADGTVALASSDNAATSITMSNEGAALIPPQTINGTFITIETNAGTAVYAVENKEFEPGYQYTLNITVNAAAIGTTNTITGWTDEGTVNVQPTVEKDNAPAGVVAVDLGLYVGGATSGKKLLWANMNVGATSVTDYGDFFAWGETSPKDYYNWTNYAWCQSSDKTLTKYCPTARQSGYWFDKSETPVIAADNKIQLDLGDDAARANWGGKWRMPTKAELDALQALTNAWTTDYNGSGVAGRTFTGNENIIFLPAAGNRDNTSVGDQGSYGYYWSSSLGESYPYYAWGMYFNSSYTNVGSLRRYYGFSVRAVCEE